MQSANKFTKTQMHYYEIKGYIISIRLVLETDIPLVDSLSISSERTCYEPQLWFWSWKGNYQEALHFFHFLKISSCLVDKWIYVICLSQNYRWYIIETFQMPANTYTIKTMYFS